MASPNHIDIILSEGLNQVRKSIADNFLSAKFGLDKFNLVLQQLEQNLNPKTEFAYYKEKQNLEFALKNGQAKDFPKLDCIETQILWAAGLALIAQNKQITAAWPKENIGTKVSDTKIWKQIKESKAIKAELYRFGHLVHAKSHKKNVKVRYGEPPSGYPNIGYYFDPQQNFVNIDLLWTLIIGYEEARGAVLHELGHAINTASFSPRMNELMAIMMALIDEPGKKPEFKKIVDALNSGRLPQDKALELKEALDEWQRRHSVFDELENNPINRWVTKQSNILSQDFGHSLSAIETVAIDVQGDSIFAANKKLVGKKVSEVSASDQLINLKRAVRMVFHQHNELFGANEWHKVCVEPQLITSVNEKGPKAFEDLRELVGGVKGAEHLIINPSDEWKGKIHFSTRVLELAEARGRIADKIYDDYFAPLYQEQEREQEQQQSQSQSNSGGQDDKKSEKGDKSENKGSPGSKDDTSKGDQASKDDDEQKNGDKAEQKDENGSKGDEQKGGDKGEEDGQSEGQDQNGGKWESQIDEKGKDQNGQGGEPDNAGDMFDSPTMARAIKKGLGKITPQKIDAELTAEELEGAFQESTQEDVGEPSIPVVLPQNNQPEAENPQKEPPKKVPPTISKIIKPVHLKDWNNYDKIKEGLSWAIQQMAEKIWQIQRKSFQRNSPEENPQAIEMREGDLRVVPQRSRNGFDIAAHRKLKELKQQGAQIGRDDYRRFKDSVPVVSANRAGGIKKVAQIDIATLIDGSDSMYVIEAGYGYREPEANENIPIEAGITGALVYHEAASLRRVNSYGGLWGNDECEIFATPDSSSDEIRRNIANLRSRRGWGTCLAPGFTSMIETIANQRATKWENIGYTHIVIVSDGDIADQEQAYRAILNVMEKCKLVTVDFAIITKDSDNKTVHLAKRLQKQFPDRIGIKQIKNIETAVPTLLDLMSGRVTASLEVEAIAKQRKSRMLKAGIE